MNYKRLIFLLFLNLSTWLNALAIEQVTDDRDSLLSQQQITTSETEDLEELKKTFLQIGVLLGLSLIVYLYVNFRFNKGKRENRAFKPKQEANQTREHIELGILQNIINSFNEPALISSIAGKVMVFNTAFKEGWPILNVTSINDFLHADGNLPATNLIKGNGSVKIKVKKTGNRQDAGSEEMILKYQPVRTLSENKHVYLLTLHPSTSQEGEQMEELISVKESIRYFRKMIDKTLDAIFVENRDGEIFEVNYAACQLHNCTREELIGKTIFDLTPGEIHASLTDKLELMNERGELKFNSFFANSKGEQMPVEISANSIDFFGEASLLLIVRDISEQVLYEKKLTNALSIAEESEKLKSSFLANMSHEVRTPMNSIMGFSELMCDNQLSEDQRREFHQIVKTSSRELLNLMDDIIEFSRIEANQIKIKTEVTTPEEIITQLKNIATEIQIQKPAIILSLDLPLGFKPETKFTTDISRMNQILRILLENAYKFTYQGEVKFGYKERMDGSICFFVEDTGIGIPIEKIPFVFEKFIQGDNTSRREFGGTGIGLAICYHLTRYLGGFIWVESEVQVGSSFNVVIPIHPRPVHAKENSSGKPALLLFSPGYEAIRELQLKLGEKIQIIHCETVKELLFIPLSTKLNYAIIDASQLDSESLTHQIHQFTKQGINTVVITRENKSSLSIESAHMNTVRLVDSKAFDLSFIESLTGI